MNRIILFRGLTASDEWVEGYYVNDRVLGHRILDSDNRYNPVKPESIGQFCGLHDKHDCSRIFEGDILSLDGTIIHNSYVKENMDKGIPHILVPRITSRDWQSAYKKLLEIGCSHSE